jgi:hypothetical protein
VVGEETPIANDEAQSRFVDLCSTSFNLVARVKFTGNPARGQM